jgi:hypothetical protein
MVMIVITIIIRLSEDLDLEVSKLNQSIYQNIHRHQINEMINHQLLAIIHCHRIMDADREADRHYVIKSTIIIINRQEMAIIINLQSKKFYSSIKLNLILR